MGVANSLDYFAIDVLSFYGKSAYSTVIRGITWSPITHTALRFLQDSLVFEALGQGVVKSDSISTYHTPGTAVEVKRLYVTKAVYEKALAEARALEGTPYDWTGAARHSPFLRIFLRDPRPENLYKQLYCSEFAKLVLDRTPIIYLDKVPWKCSPADMYESTVPKYIGREYA